MSVETVFDPASTGSTYGLVGEEVVGTPILYELELDANGRVLEEPPHPVYDLTDLPKAVAAAYAKWNPNGVAGMGGPFWNTEVARGKARVYLVEVLMNSVTAYHAKFAEDGTVLAADPARVP